MNNGWNEYVAKQVIDVHRGGWWGVWDAFVAALFKRDRFAVARPVTISFKYKGDVDVAMTQVEEGDITR